MFYKIFTITVLHRIFDFVRPHRFIDRRVYGRFVPKNSSVLDYGSGRGPYQHFLSTKLSVDYRCADIEQGIATDFKIHDAGLECGSMFDVVIASDVLQHVVNVDQVFTDVRRVLSADGIFIASTPFIYPECDFNDYWRWSEFGISTLLEANGFEVIETIRRGGPTFCVCFLILGLLQNWIAGARSGWRNPFGIWRSVLILTVELLFLPLCWFAFLVDFFLGKSPAYFGTVIVARIRR